MAKLLSVGSQTYDLGPPMVIDGLFATITYRLELDGRGTRFPIVMRRLYGAGHMNASDAASASLELQEIESGLATLLPDRAVWSLSDLRRRDDSQFPVNHGASNVRDYFVGEDGRPILAAIHEAVHLSRDRNEAVLLASSEAFKQTRAVLLPLFLGLFWTVIGCLFFRNWVITSAYDSHATGGPLIWPFGIVLFSGGLAALICNRYPVVDDWFRRQPWLVVAMFLLGIGLYLVLAWRF